MKKRKYEMKYNVRKVKNTLDRYRMFSFLSTFYRLSKTQLTTKQLHILGVLLFYSKIKKVCVKDLNESLHKQNHSSLSRLASSLEKKGLEYLNKLYYSYNMQNIDDTTFNTTANEEMVKILERYHDKKVA